MIVNTPRIREIPYNYTSFSDREIVRRFFGEEAWNLIDELRTSRRTGRSARMLFEVLGDLWVISRNPFIQDDMLDNAKRRSALLQALHHRIEQIIQRAEGDPRALTLSQLANQAIDDFERSLQVQRRLRRRLKRRLLQITRKDSIDFSGHARVSHVTDATDWRVEYPLAVICPNSEEEIAGIVAVCADLGLTIIPRGGGTGYTGGAIPLYADTVVLNTEKLIRINPIELRALPEGDQTIPCIRVEAGVVTRKVAEAAEREGWVFAVDPTSQDACTIGGNISMNAGGKKAVLWGTTVDNLFSWRMVIARGEWLEVTRLQHNLGKIHEQETVSFELQYYQADGRTPKGPAKRLTMPGASFRKVGLGKDVTDKYLGGLPGIQKEGCDGIITSAVFVLHSLPQYKRTICLEFFATDLSRAVPAIVETKAYIDSLEGVMLSGLEHLDARYIKAIRYTTKAARREAPKMILLADISSDDEHMVDSAASQIVRLASVRDAEGFIAASAEARRQFWLDRSRTAAIAAHTNAFKINEDVVIPLARLGDYSAGIERFNIQLSIRNKLDMVTELLTHFTALESLGDATIESLSEEQKSIEDVKLDAIVQLLKQVQHRWNQFLHHLDQPFTELSIDSSSDEPHSGTVLAAILAHRLVVSFRQEVEKPIKERLTGLEFESNRLAIDSIHRRVLSSRLFIATHMHAGDGNVHTNIPVNSNDYDMMHRAEKVVQEVMQLATSLGGVVSGEHGIGLTKYQYLDDTLKRRFETYKNSVDPDGLFNRGKLMPGSGLQNAYTPSLRLLQQEALILEASDLGALNDAIKNCLRCGKCKPDCTTHVPQANLYYSPRDKILATGLLIEAFLYEEQTRRGISLSHFDEMNDVADHCTICHRCLQPCPVDIDFGDVTIRMRQILNDAGKRKSKITTRLAMGYLNVTDPKLIKMMRKTLIQFGYWAQRLGHRVAKKCHVAGLQTIPKSTTGKPDIQWQVIQFLDKPLPKHLPRKTMRALLGIEDRKLIPIIRHPENTREDTEAVFYFPGCGSERLFSQIGLATMAMLYDVGVQTVLPPGYLCCGYPQTSSGDEEKGQKISTDNRVLFHRVANTLNYLDIKTVIVSCGTCMDQLLRYEFEKIFPGCQLLDIHEYLYEKGVNLPATGQTYLYHEPCHKPMKHHNAITVAESLLRADVQLTDRCCGEAGTFAVSRPDIATQVRFRKEQELIIDLERLPQKPKKVLTSCPACQQGLSRYTDNTGLEVDYIVVEMIKARRGEAWLSDFVDQVAQGGVERVLL